MVESVAGVALIVEELVDLVNILPYLGKVERPEVLEETFVEEVLNRDRHTWSMLKKKALGISLGGVWSARKKNLSA